jgi:hypothetical protein
VAEYGFAEYKLYWLRSYLADTQYGEGLIILPNVMNNRTLLKNFLAMSSERLNKL